MNITIIIDKSTFQMLSYQELLYVSSYYKHNISPVLTMEVLGDLKKEAKEGKNPSSTRVTDFARKLFPVDTIVNTHYKDLIVTDLMGNHPSLDGRPNVNVEKTVKSESGMKGQVLSISKEEQSIYKWREGDFSVADHELSELWRSATTQEDLLTKLKDALVSTNGKVTIKNFAELSELVDKVLQSPEIQQELLKSAIDIYEVPADVAVKIFSRWHSEGQALLKDFCPYTYHCLKVDNLFLFGLTNDLVTTRPTNRVDCEYLYYLPFCNVFTSNDKFHKNLVPLLLRPDQKFVTGEEFKKDMILINNYFEEKGVEVRKKFKNEPPLIEESLTYQLWKEYFDYPKESNLKRNLSDKEMEMMRRKMDELEGAMKGEKIEMQEGEETEFIIKESYLSADDPCFCGSGKKVIECCIPPEEFTKLAKKS
ncbi:SEC-C domain-containing protein [Pinibacter aurantiacus]|uniref:SEC-C domain-containing protein n=1 Tax=Pinibacter aurantiacus TaxID=2851599 RepID=A0A9E2SAE7_9BACT|nr:SEC-C domain-containing protein [Pinibacter aurantiacus]MBV4356305.1 SEC-C domain-containing protein [Pinibacter aurantiacus]